jgi:hypothetical protein
VAWHGEGADTLARKSRGRQEGGCWLRWPGGPIRLVHPTHRGDLAGFEFNS